MRFLEEQQTSADSFVADEKQKDEMERKHKAEREESMYYSKDVPTPQPSEEPSGFADDDKPSFADEEAS